MYLVVWTTQKQSLRDQRRTISRDRWEACETLAEAKAKYAELIAREDVWSASLCTPLESTDYTAGDEGLPEDVPCEDEPGGHASEALDFLNNRR